MTPSTSEGGLPPPPHRMELQSQKGGAEAQREGEGGSTGRTAEGGCTADDEEGGGEEGPLYRTSCKGAGGSGGEVWGYIGQVV